MRKKIHLLLLACTLHASIPIPLPTEQLLVVSGNTFGSNKASLQAYEKENSTWKKVFDPIEVNLGRHGLAWGEGLLEFEHPADEPLKYEGDGKSPAGLFSLDLFFGYEDQDFDFPYLKVNDSTLCIDDASSEQYNRIIQEKDLTKYTSFEFMRRKDRLYHFGILVGHNKTNLKKRGSCIFIHIAKQAEAFPERNVSLKQAEAVSERTIYPEQPDVAGHMSSVRLKTLPTAGCTSMQEEKLVQLMQWLDKDKEPLLLQLPLLYLQEGFK